MSCMQPRMAMNAAQHKIVTLHKTLWDFFVIACHSAFNVWPSTTLLPVWSRDAKRLDSPGAPKILPINYRHRFSRLTFNKRKRKVFVVKLHLWPWSWLVSVKFSQILLINLLKEFLSAYDTTDHNHSCAKLYNANVISVLFNILQQAFNEILSYN